MRTNTMEITLKIILRISGIMLIAALGAVFLPYETMAVIHKHLGLGQFPNLPVLDYLARSVSLFYAMHGVIIIYISFDLIKYLKFLKMLCCLGIVFGIALFIIDIQAPMPAYWIYIEGPFIIILNLLIYVLAKMLK